jgi:low affinity Fe/Cu permease
MIYVIILTVAILITYSLVFILGYYATTDRIRSQEDVEYEVRENPLRSNKITYTWRLNPEEIDKIEDWEEFENRVEE